MQHDRVLPRSQPDAVTAHDRSRVVHLPDARALLPGPGGHHAATVFQRGTLDVKLAVAPAVPPVDLTPHAQDEVYVVVRGRGVLRHGDRRDPFAAGDLMFVAAGVEHRFEEFTDDLVVWVIFHGPKSGDASELLG